MTFLAFLTAFAFFVAALAFRGKCGPPGNGSTCFLTFLTGFRFLTFLAAFFLPALGFFAFFAVFDALAMILPFLLRRWQELKLLALSLVDCINGQRLGRCTSTDNARAQDHRGATEWR